MARDGPSLARAVSDADDRLTSADEPLASLQLQCGGDLPGVIAVPALLETVRKSRRYQLKLGRTISAQNGAEAITAWVEIEPRSDGELGCDIALHNWHVVPIQPEEELTASTRKDGIDRQVAELTAMLDAGQNVLTVDVKASDLEDLARHMQQGAGQPWTDFITVDGSSHRQPLHWRLLDDARVSIEGSERGWRARLFPVEIQGEGLAGFELLLVADEPPPAKVTGQKIAEADVATSRRGIVGQEIAPVLRQPIARIIANAETIKTRLAGPLADEYADYAREIANAGQHLLGLLDDLSDLEVVESEEFSTAPDHIDLADVARQAAGILGVRAKEKDISLDAPKLGESLPAIAEFRRVLQILLNLIGNAIRYSPTGSQIWIRLEEAGDLSRLVVADQGPGLSPEDCARVFEKFERLGRSGDGGSGLGLYISRRLARVMGGELTVESAPGQGARFILELPAGEGDSPAAPGQPDEQ